MAHIETGKNKQTGQMTTVWGGIASDKASENLQTIAEPLLTSRGLDNISG
ncbi:hypothetical protein MY1884_009751, partial [Beauveria asiatica]